MRNSSCNCTRSSSKTSFSISCTINCIFSWIEACFEQICSSWAFGKIVELLMICTISPKSLNWRKCHFYYILYYKLHFHQKPLVYKFAQNRHLWISCTINCSYLQVKSLFIMRNSSYRCMFSCILATISSFKTSCSISKSLITAIHLTLHLTLAPKIYVSYNYK